MADPRFKRTVTANFRWPPDRKLILARAAEARGMSLTDYTLSAGLILAGRPDLASDQMGQEALHLKDTA